MALDRVKVIGGLSAHSAVKGLNRKSSVLSSASPPSSDRFESIFVP